MSTDLLVVGGIVVVFIVGIVLLMRWVKRTRNRMQRADSADLRAISAYAASQGLSIAQAAHKSAFTASGTLEGIPVSLTTSHLELVVRGRTVQGPIETHLRTRGLPASIRALVARPVPATGDPDGVIDPPSRGADRLPSGDPGLDARFRCYAASPEQLAALLDPSTLQQIKALPELREVRLAEGELSISLIPPHYLDGGDGAPFHHVRPLVKKRETLDRAAQLLARLRESAGKLG